MKVRGDQSRVGPRGLPEGPLNTKICAYLSRTAPYPRPQLSQVGQFQGNNKKADNTTRVSCILGPTDCHPYYFLHPPKICRLSLITTWQHQTNRPGNQDVRMKDGASTAISPATQLPLASFASSIRSFSIVIDTIVTPTTANNHHRVDRLKYPRLSFMVLHLLTIQAIPAECKKLFSSAGKIVTSLLMSKTAERRK
ncbi:uncharacterized protein BCR38DRAFT_82186 [Pseudomassariella vexata]|uniref:HAT C-terminal dimerisation domain-containing protein n=1 Tax=Pseudomassariella vexata TaxID=1141098 RepID=A0A1Y2DGS6_9PEZI|nr:uncharacterized protein BCR38DRAFT_82186 [Pseudomassariella vexata]ORY57905.1 hypothetical protein BCR38DRAFT_82186 [Pseudomassariella vexata]